MSNLTVTDGNKRKGVKTMQTTNEFKKRRHIRYLLIAMLAGVMIFAFCACGEDGTEEDTGDEVATTITTTEVESNYETVTYAYSDSSDEEDLYSISIIMEHDGDKVMKVTEMMVDDMRKGDPDLIPMQMENLDGALDETGLKDMEGFTWDVQVKDNVRTETKTFDMTKFDIERYKSYIGLKSDKDYISLEELAARYEKGNFQKVEN